MRNQMTDFKAFKEFDESISPWKPQFSDSFFFPLLYEKREHSPQIAGITIDP